VEYWGLGWEKEGGPIVSAVCGRTILGGLCCRVSFIRRCCVRHPEKRKGETKNKEGVRKKGLEGSGRLRKDLGREARSVFLKS